MSDLRTRIAAALYDHWWHGTTTLREPPVWAKLSDSARDEWLRQADAVIRELEKDYILTPIRDGYCTCHSDQKGCTPDCGIAVHRMAAHRLEADDE